MNWYLIIKFLHIITAMLTIGGIFARQLVRSVAKKSDDINEIASLTRAAIRLDRALIIPSSNVMVLAGIILAVIQKWPLFGFLQGDAQNWLLLSNLLFLVMMCLIFFVVVPHNKKVDSKLQTALTEGRVTQELLLALDDKFNKWVHHLDEILMITITALMVLKPF